MGMSYRGSDRANERRVKSRFPIRREVRYKLLEEGATVASGAGETCDLSSGGVSFTPDGALKPGAFVELSISWPVLLDERCAMRLIAFGRVVWTDGHKAACTIDKYEFRTQARTYQMPTRNDSMLLRWADSCQKENSKVRALASA
jgi:PilZ domain